MAPGLEAMAEQRDPAGRASAQAGRHPAVRAAGWSAGALEDRREPPPDAVEALAGQEGPPPPDVEDDVDEALLIDGILGHLRAERA